MEGRRIGLKPDYAATSRSTPKNSLTIWRSLATDSAPLMATRSSEPPSRPFVYQEPSARTLLITHRSWLCTRRSVPSPPSVCGAVCLGRAHSKENEKTCFRRSDLCRSCFAVRAAWCPGTAAPYGFRFRHAGIIAATHSSRRCHHSGRCGPSHPGGAVAGGRSR